MIKNSLFTAASFTPKSLQFPNAWVGHLPFAAWMIQEVSPKIFVELGTHSGNSYFSFCQSVVEADLSTKCYAVDTWQGDEHAGQYGDEIFAKVNAHHQEHFAGFSRLLRMTFDDALTYFADESIELLHIDGLHTYEAVRHDFETWLPKLAPGAVVIFHDTNVRERNFGVWKLWSELQDQYQNNLEFVHSHGLGVLQLNNAPSSKVLEWLQPNSPERPILINYFAALGSRQLVRYELIELKQHANNLNQSMVERDGQIASLNQSVTERDGQIACLNQVVAERDGQIASLRDETVRRGEWALRLDAELKETQAKLAAITQSNSWSLTKPLRELRRWISHPVNQARRYVRSDARFMKQGYRVQNIKSGLVALLRRTRNAAGYAFRGEWRALAERLTSLRREAALEQRLGKQPTSIRHVGVMATPHTLFIAHQLAHALQKAGIEADILTKPPEGGFLLDAYFVVCPQMFSHLPPGEKRIAFQMEQSVSPRWFTPDYLEMLEDSLVVLDYAQANLEFLDLRGIRYPHTFFVPIGGFTGYRNYLQRHHPQALGSDATCDVLFYGDANVPRRQQLLAAIGERYQLRTVGNLFGTDLHRALANARLVVNLHYYEGALLETTRILECLSLGLPVVSETSADQAAHATLEGAVRFVPVGDVAALLQAIDDLLGSTPQQTETAQREREVAIAATQTRFEFMLYRMLLAQRWLDYPQFHALTSATPIHGPKLALSLPETTARRAKFISHKAPDVLLFDGLRYTPGWIGCALSYKYLAQKALSNHWPQLEVMEDDVLFPSDYPQRKSAVDAYLTVHAGQWDIFAGLIADLHPDTQVLSVERYDGQLFITLDRMTSMVHNVYSTTALHLLANWDASNIDPESNTIDRYLQTRPQLRVITILPFLVHHNEDLHSTLWGFQNTQYRDIISNSEAELKAKVTLFECNGNNNHHPIVPT